MKVKLQLRKQVYEKILTEPAKTDYEIADEIGLSRSYIYSQRQKFIRTLDYTLAQEVAGKFLADFQMASDYFKLKITDLNSKLTDLEELKKGKKTIFKKKDDGKYIAVKVDLEVLDILAIEKQIMETTKLQAQLWKDIVFLARQSEAVEVMKLIQNGRIQLPTPTG